MPFEVRRLEADFFERRERKLSVLDVVGSGTWFGGREAVDVDTR